MKNRFLSVLAIICLALIAATFMGCPPPSVTDTTTTTDTTTPPATVDTAARDKAIADGIAALKVQDFDLAMTKFTAAASIDPQSVEALTWKALMDLASLSTDPDIVTLMRDRVGLLDYPSSMNALFKNTWFNGAWYETYWGLVPVTNPVAGNFYYVRGTFTSVANGQFMSYYPDARTTSPQINDQGTFTPSNSGPNYSANFYTGTEWRDGNTYMGTLTMYTQGMAADLAMPVLLPRMTVPAWASSYVGSSVAYEDATHLGTSSFPVILLLNIISRNPTGLDDALDLVLSGLFGSRFATVMNEIAALPATTLVQIPNDLFAAYGMTPTATQKIMLNKSELLGAAASLKSVKSFLQLLSSYSLNYPLTNLNVAMWDSTDTNSDGIPDWLDTFLANAPNPVKAGMLTTRSAAARTAARTTMLDALDTMTTAIGLFPSDVNSYLTDVTGSPATPEMVINTQNYLAGGKTAVAAFRSAIAASAPLYVDWDAITNGTAWTSTYAWPTSVGTSTSIVTMYPDRLYTDDLLNPGKLMLSVSSGGKTVGLKAYGVVRDEKGVLTSKEELTNQATQAGNTYTGIELALDWARVDTFEVLPSTMKPTLTTEGWFMVPLFGGSPTAAALTSAQWTLVNWMRGN